MLRDQEWNDEHPQGVFGGCVQNYLQWLNQALYIPTWNNKLWTKLKCAFFTSFFPLSFVIFSFVLPFLFLILFFLGNWIWSRKSGFCLGQRKIFLDKIMANFLPHELTDKKEIWYSIIDLRKFLVHVLHIYKNLVFCDDYFHNS